MAKRKLPGFATVLILTIVALVFSKGRVLRGNTDEPEPMQVPPDDLHDERTLKIVIAERAAEASIDC